MKYLMKVGQTDHLDEIIFDSKVFKFCIYYLNQNTFYELSLYRLISI